jgi:hypothetical protein
MMNERGGSNDLAEFSFESEATAGLPAAVFLRLGRRASLYNVRAGVTGRLRLQDGRFAGLLEGRCSVILPLAARIMADGRHGAIRTTAFGALDARRFADWAVGGFELEGTEAALAENLRFIPAGAAMGCDGLSASIHGIGTATV